MQKELGKEYKTPREREAFLRDNCDKAEQRGYMKRFTPSQLHSRKENLANISISIFEIEIEKKKTMLAFKDRLKPLVDEREKMISDIRDKAEYVRETCYMFVDQEEKEVGYYNSDGDLIELRSATVNELQPTIFSLSRKTGTDDQ